jgi:hypothetical protein
MHKTEFVEFHITETCNLTCSGCNRYNNLGLRGHEDWDKNKEHYKKFASFVEVKSADIIGGEPLQHPQIITIIKDIRNFFPNSNMNLWTNGLLLDQIPNLKNAIIENNVRLEISIHNKKFRKIILKKIKSLFDGDIKFLRPSIKTGTRKGTHNFWFESNNGVDHRIRLSENFYQNALNDPYGVNLKPHESDSSLAWKACNTKCPTLARGKFHKCPVSHCMPVAVRQRNDIMLNDKQRALIDSFPYIECKDIDKVSEEYWRKFLREKIDQCSLCPEQFVSQPNGIQQIKR